MIKNHEINGADVIIADTPKEVDEEAAFLVSSSVLHNSRSVLGLAAGNSTAGVFKAILPFLEKYQFSFSCCKAFAMDEYIGLPETCPASCRDRIMKSFIIPVGIQSSNFHSPRPKDDMAACMEYENDINVAGGIDLFILGLGVNGHVGFNEPLTDFDRGVHIAELSTATLEAGKQKFEAVGYHDNVPHKGITVGLRNIMKSRSILVVAKGHTKSSAIASSLLGEITTSIPASVLRLHPNVTFVLDKDSAADL